MSPTPASRGRLLVALVLAGVLLGAPQAFAADDPVAPAVAVEQDGGTGLTDSSPDLDDPAVFGSGQAATSTIGARAPAAGHGDVSTSLADIAHLVGADRLWERGLTGRGVDVALVDTGVLPVVGLDGAGKVVQGPDLSFESQAPGAAGLDAYGHGTHLAGIMVGSGNDQRGIAPDARLLNVRVGASDGAVDVSQIVAAVDWIVQHGHDGDLDVRVINLSLGTDSTQAARIDPLVKAVDNAWRHGFVVVAAVGNDGRADHRVSTPANDPNVLAVGATDSAGSTDPASSRAAPFSARGSGRTPDLLAPGARVTSLRAPGSFLDEQFPAARRGAALFRGSGTSQSAAVVSGAAALLLQARPELTPDEVKALLLHSAAPVAEAGRYVGRRQLDIAAAVDAPVPAVQQLVPVDGTGSLDATRGSSRVVLDDVPLTGERDIFGAPFDSTAWAPLSAAGGAWKGGAWNGNTWSGNTWSGNTWSGNTWSGNTWSGNTWSGNTWSGNTWSGNTWSGNTWSGNTWSGNTWSGNTWSGNTWSGNTWSGNTWSGNTWSGNTWSGNTWSGGSWE